jgi:chromosome segregation ATPase
LKTLRSQSDSLVPLQLENEILKSKLKDQDNTLENLHKAKNDLEEKILNFLSKQVSLEASLEEAKSDLTRCRQERDSKVSEANNQISLLELEIQKSTNQKSLTEDLLQKTQTLQQDLKFTKSALESFQELNLSLTQKNAEVSNSLGKMHSSHIPLYIADQLRRELAEKARELEELREENKKKTEILKNTKTSINNTKAEIANWKKCLDEKNLIIQELRNEARKGEEEHPEVKFLRKALQNKEKELKELKDKGQEYYTQADQTIENMRRKCLVYQNETYSLREEIKGIHQPEKFRSAVFRENDEVCVRKDDFFNLKNLNNKLSEELRVSRETSENLQRQNMELIKRINEDGFRKREGDLARDLMPKVSGIIRPSSLFSAQ